LLIVLLHQNRRYAPLPLTDEQAANSSPTPPAMRSDDLSPIQAPGVERDDLPEAAVSPQATEANERSAVNPMLTSSSISVASRHF